MSGAGDRRTWSKRGTAKAGLRPTWRTWVEGALRACRGRRGALPSQEGQQGPRRGCAQGAGGQGSRRQDTEPSRQRQRRQGSPGGEKCSWWRAGTKPSGSGQPERGAEVREPASRGGQGEAAEGTPRGGAAKGCSSYLGTAGSTLRAARPALRRAGDRSGEPGTARCRSACRDGPGQAGLVAGAKETPAPAHPTVVDLPCPPQVPPRLPWTPPPIQVADSPDSDTGGRRQWGGGSLLHWDTLSQQRHSLGKGTAIGLGEDRLTL